MVDFQAHPLSPDQPLAPQAPIDLVFINAMNALCDTFVCGNNPHLRDISLQTLPENRYRLGRNSAQKKAAATLNKLLPPWRRLRLKIQGKIVVRGQSGLIWVLAKNDRRLLIVSECEQDAICQGNTASDCPWEDWATGIYLHIKSGIKGETEIVRTSGIGDGDTIRDLPREMALRLLPAPSLVSAWGRMRRYRNSQSADLTDSERQT